jgi:hypothetical protein
MTHAKDKCTTIAKGDTNNAKHVAIDSAHAQCNKLTIGLAQCSNNTVYRLGSAFNQTIKNSTGTIMSALPSRTKCTCMMPPQPLASW